MAKSKATIDMSDAGGVVVDFSEIADLGPVPANTYEASIVHAEQGTSQSGHPKIDVRWRIEEGEFEGRQIFDTLAFHPNALAITKAKLLSLGFPKDFSGELDPEDLLGATATLRVTIQESTKVNPETGEVYAPRNRVNRISSGSIDLGDVV